MTQPSHEEARALDLWKHRSKGMQCGTCMFFVEKKPLPQEQVPDDIKDQKVLGRCRRHAPTMSGWPAVFTHDWCGDHKLDENKLGGMSHG
jgi:hypothetical protein